MKAYLYQCPRNTTPEPQQVEIKESPLNHHKLGLSYTATGYGSKLPTRYMVGIGKRWYRVYSICYSNVSTEYVIYGGSKVKVDIEV